VEATGVGGGGDGSGHEIDPIPEVSGEYAVADGVAGRSGIARGFWDPESGLPLARGKKRL
jgi:hypothetical protein